MERGGARRPETAGCITGICGGSSGRWWSAPKAPSSLATCISRTARRCTFTRQSPTERARGAYRGGCRFGGYLSRGLPPILFEALPGFAQLKGGTWQIDDVVTYDSNELAQIGRAVLAEYGAKHVVIEKALLSSSNGERLRRVADAMLGETSMVYDEIITAYHVTPPASPPSQTLWLDTGWSYLEQSGESDPSGRTRRWRWMADAARVGVMSPRPATVRLRLSVRSFKRPRRVRFSIGEQTVAAERRGLSAETWRSWCAVSQPSLTPTAAPA